MKTKFAKEKSEYSRLIWQNIENFNLTEEDRRKNFVRIQELEKEVKKQGDKIITIVTTENTTPIKYASAMSMKNIKKG
jgi:hypothetical protein